MQTEGRSPALWLSVPLAILVAFAAFAGLFWTSTYAHETDVYAAQGIGGDAFKLAVVVPALLVSFVLALKGSIGARLVWTGTLLYLIYDFIFYTFAVHFNALFLVYCAVLGLSFYALAWSLSSLPVDRIQRAYSAGAPATSSAILLLAVAAAAAAMWLRDIIPALLAGRAPQSVAEAGLLTHPAHVLDLSLLLPAFAIAGVLLLRGRPLGFVLGPVFLAVGVLLSLLIASIMLAMGAKGFGLNYGGLTFNFVLAAANAFLLGLFVRRRYAA